jgi:hypothetical protein
MVAGVSKTDGLLCPTLCITNNSHPLLAGRLKRFISSSSYMALQPISGLGLLFMRFSNLTLIDGW